MRRSLVLLGLAACKYSGPTENAPGDGNPVDPDMQVVDPDAPDAPPPTVWLHPYAHRKRITLLEAKIDDTGGALNNFPVLISLDDPDLGAATQLADMVFTTDDALTQLDSEIEKFAGNQLVAWVRIPALSATASTAIYMYYGNPTPLITNPQNVWMQNFLGVWHFSQDPGASNVLDSTANNRNGNPSGAMTAANRVPAKIGDGYSFPNNPNTFVDYGTLNVGNNFTISMWATLAANASNTVNTMLANSGQAAETNGFRFFLNTADTNNRRVIFETGDGNNSSTCETNVNAVTFNVPAHVVAVIDRGGGNCALFVNGVNATSGNDDVQNDFQNNSDWEVGRMESNSLPFRGVLDEVNIANVRRAPGWIATTFNNQSVPGEFYTVGAEEDEPPR